MIYKSLKHCFLFSISIILVVATVKAQVTLKDNGTKVTISNGLISMVVVKGSAQVTSVSYKGSVNLLGSKGDYYTVHVTHDSVDAWLGLSASSFKVVTNTADEVDIAMKNPKLGADSVNVNGFFDVTKHYVVHRGDAGYYTYVVWKHHANQPAGGFYQQRTTFDGCSLFNSSSTRTSYDYSGVEKNGASIGGDLLTNSITNAVYKLPLTSYYTDSVGYTEDHYPVWTKYDWAVYSGDSTSNHNTWGSACDQYGIWRLCPSEEFLNGGPTKLRGGVQAGEVDLNTNEGHGIGNVDNSISKGLEWQKVYGPFKMYFNAGTDHNQLWADAQQKGKQEVAQWPYSWVNEPDSVYTKTRSNVIGQITVPGKSTAYAMVILGKDTSFGDDTGINWMFQGGTNYLFWNKADSTGRFSIPKVRPGTYKLFSYIPGIFNELQIKNIVVGVDSTTDLGIINWDAPMRQQTIWRIGTPDHSAGEFKWGQRMRQFGLWWRYLEETGQNDLNYTIGQSNEATDWYYAQPVVAVAKGAYFAPKWNVKFNLSTIPPNPAVVRFALSGSMGSAYYIDVNGTTITPGGTKGVYTIDDMAYYRDNIKVGQYSYAEYSFNPKLLKLGDNTITIRQRKTASNTWDTTKGKPVLPGGGIQYDCIELAAGKIVSSSSLLPLSLTQFVGTLLKDKTCLVWTTTNEQKTKVFEVETSTDGKVFSTLSSVLANGGINSFARYQFVDEAPKDGINYYRLKIVDNNGIYTYSKTISINKALSTKSIELTAVYPNAFSNQLTVNCNAAKSEKIEMQIVSSNGIVLKSIKVAVQKGKNSLQLNNLEALASGVYFLKLIGVDSGTVQRVVKL